MPVRIRRPVMQSEIPMVVFPSLHAFKRLLLLPFGVSFRLINAQIPFIEKVVVFKFRVSLYSSTD